MAKPKECFGLSSEDAEGSDSEDGYMARQDSDSESEASSSETELSGLKQQRQEWKAEKEALLREMGQLR